MLVSILSYRGEASLLSTVQCMQHHLMHSFSHISTACLSPILNHLHALPGGEASLLPSYNPRDITVCSSIRCQAGKHPNGHWNNSMLVIILSWGSIPTANSPMLVISPCTFYPLQVGKHIPILPIYRVDNIKQSFVNRFFHCRSMFTLLKVNSVHHKTQVTAFRCGAFRNM